VRVHTKPRLPLEQLQFRLSAGLRRQHFLRRDDRLYGCSSGLPLRRRYRTPM